MDEIRQEFLNIVTRVRAHLEYQKALGVRVISVNSTPGPASRHTVTNSASVNPPASPSVKGGTNETPPLQKGGEGGFVAPASTLAAVREELGDCTRCKLYKGRSNIVFGEGDPKAVLVFVGEGPGQEEDEQGRPFVGAAGQLLTDIIVKGMKLRREDVYICNIVKCRPPDNRNPEPDEIEACEQFLKKQLQAINPGVIIALGNVAVKTLLKTDKGITTLRGKWQAYEGIPLMPTFHPAYLLRNAKDKKLVWEDIQKVMEKLGMKVKA